MISLKTDPHDQLHSHYMNTRIWTLGLALALSSSGFSQNLEYARGVIKELCSDEMAGRGYVNDGDNAAAYYIEKAFEKHGLQAWDYDYNQQFAFPVNSFPDKVDVILDGVTLKPGADFIVSPACPSIKGEYPLMPMNEFAEVNDRGVFADTAELHGMVLLVQDSIWNNFMKQTEGRGLNALVNAGCKGVVKLTDKLTWGVSRSQDPIPVVDILRSSFKQGVRIKFDIEAVLKKKHRTQNVMGYFEGNEESEKFIVFTGHYDHLGMMGKEAMFKGANDNASGIAMMLNMVEYYSDEKNRGKYSIAFIAFAGEEAGLMGSFYYVQNPVFPLKDIAFIMNVDLMGTGKDGVTIVNGAVHEEEFNRMVSINDENKYLKRIKKRGKPPTRIITLSQKWVSLHFSCTQWEELPPTMISTMLLKLFLSPEFEDVFRLIRDFNHQLQE